MCTSYITHTDFECDFLRMTVRRRDTYYIPRGGPSNATENRWIRQYPQCLGFFQRVFTSLPWLQTHAVNHFKDTCDVAARHRHGGGTRYSTPTTTIHLTGDTVCHGRGWDIANGSPFDAMCVIPREYSRIFANISRFREIFAGLGRTVISYIWLRW